MNQYINRVKFLFILVLSLIVIIFNSCKKESPGTIHAQDAKNSNNV